MSNPRRKLLLTAGFALVGAFFGIAGTGHAYLRRWRRSLLWLLLTIGAGVALMSVYVNNPESIDPFDVSTVPTEVYVPMVVIIGFSVVDAIIVAFLDEREAAMTPEIAPDGEAADEGVSCPHCGRSTDPDLDFCTWCTEPLSMADHDASAADSR
ncbi:MAG: DUF7575 domain-containing protein [Halohasta sp.]